MWSRSLYHSILADHKPAIQINLEHLTYGRVCPVDRMKLRSSRPHESESQVQAASTFGSGFDNFARETTRTFKISRCLPSLPFLTLRAAPTYETQPFHGCRKRRRCSSGNKSRPGHRHSPRNGFRIQRTNRVRERSHPLGSGRSHPRLVGVWSAMYRLQTLDQAPLVLAVLPHALQSATRCVSTAVPYLLLVSALCA